MRIQESAAGCGSYLLTPNSKLRIPQAPEPRRDMMTRFALTTTALLIALAVGSQSARAQDVNLTSPVTTAGLYPSPVQRVPAGVGGTYVTNPAFYPHEMTYAHEHHYLAPPFYYVPNDLPFNRRQSGLQRFWSFWKGECQTADCRICTKCQSDCCHGDCHLRGTEIIVKYHSRRRVRCTLFHPPN